MVNKYSPMYNTLWNSIRLSLITMIAALAGIAAVGISAGKYFAEKNAEKRRTSESLYNELHETAKSLNHETFPEDFLTARISDRDGNMIDVLFMNRYLNHDSYNSVIYSGHFNFLEPSLQQPVQYIFKVIKLHNVFLEKVMLALDRQEDLSTSPEVHSYCRWLAYNQPFIIAKSLDVAEKLQKHFKIR